MLNGRVTKLDIYVSRFYGCPHLEGRFPAARQRDEHLVDQVAQVGQADAADGVLAHDDAGAEGLHRRAQVGAHQAPRRAERPTPHICMSGSEL